MRPAQAYDYVFDGADFIRRSAYVFEPTDETALQKYWDVRQMGAAYRACRSVSNKKALVQKFRDEEKVSEALEYLCAENLMLNIGEDYLALAIDWRVAKGRT